MEAALINVELILIPSVVKLIEIFTPVLPVDNVVFNVVWFEHIFYVLQ